MNDIQRTIRTIIIDDEEHSIAELKYLLQQYPDVRIIESFTDVGEALQIMGRLRPDLIFMDIEMPEINGIKAAETLRETFISPPLLVFATAHEEFALKAFEVNAVDYILKPFSSEAILRCIEKIRKLILPVISATDMKNTNQLPDIHERAKRKLVVEQDKKKVIIDIGDVVMACSTVGQLTIFTKDKSYKSPLSLNELQKRIDKTLFFRCHRGYLVNIEKIIEIVPWFNGTYNLIMSGFPSINVPVSRPQAAKLKMLFHF